MISVLRKLCVCPGFGGRFGVGLAPRVLMQLVELVQMVGKGYVFLAPLYDLRVCVEKMLPGETDTCPHATRRFC